MVQGSTNGSEGAQIVYDGDCPFCSAYVSLLRLKSAAGPVTLTDARGHPDLVADLAARGFDIDTGMVLIFGCCPHRSDRSTASTP